MVQRGRGGHGEDQGAQDRERQSLLRQPSWKRCDSRDGPGASFNVRPTDHGGHLYGAIIASLRNYIKDKRAGKYAEYHLAFCLHYVGDLSQPLHNIVYDEFNRRNHAAVDGVVNDEVLDNLQKIKTYPIVIDSEEALAKEVARIANISMQLGYRLQKENRLLTKEEAYSS